MRGLDEFFELRQRGTTVTRELRGAVATFLTMAYILVANPIILKDAGIPFHAAVAATALAAGVCSILMGLTANVPIALASGMGLNAIVAYQLTTAAGSWQAAMGLIVLDGIVTLVLVVVGVREAVLSAIPRDLRMAIGAGIGLFIAFIGLQHAHIVVKHPATLVTAGKLSDPVAQVAAIGILLTSVLLARKITGALVIGIVLTTVIGLLFGVTHRPESFHWPSFETVFQADIRGALHWRLMPLLFAVIMVDFFDTLGTASAIAEEAELTDDQGRIPKVRRLLMVDSASASIGGLLGASSVTSYIESAAGVAEGARTGLHSVFVGLMFLAAIFLAPAAGFVPPAATAPALILVGFLMIGQIARIRLTELQSAIPAFITFLTIPLTFSIAHGIGYGFIAFVLIKLLSGRWREVHPLMYGAAIAFALNFWVEATH
jgi:AGZA family xanthine/uracil permease-like MFS transporter